MLIHENRMRDLIAFTRKNSKTNPYGCSIYSLDGLLLVKMCANDISPIHHAEILAINECAKKYPGINWNELLLYTTGEPCCMCAAATCWANLKEVIYATSIPFMISLWGIESPLRAIDIIKKHPNQPKLFSEVCAEESNKMFEEYKNSFAETLKKYHPIWS